MTHVDDALPPSPEQDEPEASTERLPYEPPKVQSVKLSDEAAESLT